jgi:hypothetical protein
MMGTTFSRFARLRLAAALLTLNVGACAAQGHSYPPPVVRAGLVQVDVYDRANGSTLPLYAKDGRRYIVGTPGHEYAVRVSNRTGARVLVVTSVDGVNVISGDTAAPSQSGYVLDPWGSVEIIGWRKNLERTAAFFFTEHENSYAARTGRPANVGVIGVAVFREKVQPISRRDLELRGGPVASASPSQAPRAADGPEAAANTEAPAAAARERDTSDARHESLAAAAKTQSKLGTGHGRNEASRVTMVNFERAGETPAETVAIQYDRRENLVAMGVLPGPRLSRREPEPFPGAMRFAPDPDR